MTQRREQLLFLVRHKWAIHPSLEEDIKSRLSVRPSVWLTIKVCGWKYSDASVWVDWVDSALLRSTPGLTCCHRNGRWGQTIRNTCRMRHSVNVHIWTWVDSFLCLWIFISIVDVSRCEGCFCCLWCFCVSLKHSQELNCCGWMQTQTSLVSRRRRCGGAWLRVHSWPTPIVQRRSRVRRGRVRSWVSFLHLN